MKKHLLATTAMVAAGILAANTAAAQTTPIQLKVGGYMEQWVGWSWVDSKYSGQNDINDLDVQMDAEIHFTGRTTLDNGLTFGVNVQMEAEGSNSSTDTVDEAYLFVRGDFGEILLGSENGAAYAMHYGLGSHGTGLDSGDLSNWIVGTDFALHTTSNFARRDNDSNKIRWISPRFSGVQLGLSWAPEATQDDDGFPQEVSGSALTGDNDRLRNEEGVAAGAINYDNKFGSTRIRASLGGQYFTDSNQNGDEPWTVAAGLRVGFGAFEVGAAYSLENDVGFTIDSRQVLGGSVTYADGPIGVSFNVTYGVNDSAVAGTGDDTQWGAELGGKYKLGPGVEARGSLFYANRDEGVSGPVPAGQSNGDTQGFALVGGIRLVF